MLLRLAGQLAGRRIKDGAKAGGLDRGGAVDLVPAEERGQIGQVDEAELDAPRDADVGGAARGDRCDASDERE